MSHSYDAILSPTELDLSGVLEVVDEILAASAIGFTGEVYRLHSSNGTPSVTTADPIDAPDIEDIAQVAARWWGVSLCGWWEGIGEVYIRLFKSDNAGFHVVYNESGSAFRSRLRDPDLADALLRFLLRLAGRLGSSICIYDQESLDGFHEATAERAADILDSRRFPSGGYQGIVIVDEALLRSKPNALQAVVSTSGYVIFNSLKRGA